jgi:hypothetical protein
MKTWNPFKKKRKPLSEMGFDEFQEYLADLFNRVDLLCREPVPAAPPMELLNTNYKKRFGR